MTDCIQAFAVKRPQLLDIRFPSGQLEVQAAVDGEVTVQINGPHAGEFAVSQSGSTVAVQLDGRRGLGGSSHEVILTAPAGSRLAAKVASADITTDGVFGDVMISTASGDTFVGGSVEALDVKTASGRLEVETCTGPLRVRTASGRVHVIEAIRESSITTASGEVVVDVATGDVNIKTASGRISIGRFDSDLCSLKSVSGGVRVGVPPGRTVQIDLQSLSGRIDLPSEPGQHSGPDRLIRIRAKTVSGNIAIDVLDEPGAG